MRKKIHTLAKSLIKAYTLAEVLITLVIVAIIAVVLAPLANKMRPDSKKVTYLKSYDALVNAVQKATKNSSLYSPYYRPSQAVNPDNRVYNVSHYPLINTQEPKKAPFNDTRYSGVNKLGNVLMDLLGSKYADDSYRDFFTSNGVEWFIDPTETTYDASNVTFKGTVTIDIDGRKPGCGVYSATCKKPDKFTFVITPTGEVLASDEYGQAYLDTRREFFKKEVVPTAVTVPTISVPLEELDITNDETVAEALAASVPNSDDCEHNQAACEVEIIGPCDGDKNYTKEDCPGYCDQDHFNAHKSVCCQKEGETDRCACVVNPNGEKCCAVSWNENRCCKLAAYKSTSKCQ